MLYAAPGSGHVRHDTPELEGGGGGGYLGLPVTSKLLKPFTADPRTAHLPNWWDYPCLCEQVAGGQHGDPFWSVRCSVTPEWPIFSIAPIIPI